MQAFSFIFRSDPNLLLGFLPVGLLSNTVCPTLVGCSCPALVKHFGCPASPVFDVLQSLRGPFFDLCRSGRPVQQLTSTTSSRTAPSTSVSSGSGSFSVGIFLVLDTTRLILEIRFSQSLCRNGITVQCKWKTPTALSPEQLKVLYSCGLPPISMYGSPNFSSLKVTASQHQQVPTRKRTSQGALPIFCQLISALPGRSAFLYTFSLHPFLQKVLAIDSAIRFVSTYISVYSASLPLNSLLRSFCF